MREVVVAVEEHGISPPLGEMERELGEFHGLGNVHGCEHDVAVVAVAPAAGGLEVVRLGPPHVEDDEGEVREGGLGEGFLHER